MGGGWSKEERKVRALVDALGHGMDTAIVPAVVALRLLGFHTIASCGGHLNRHTGGPYVLIESPQAASRAREAQAMSEDNPSYLALRERADVARATDLRRLCQWLRRFYDGREVDHDSRIMAHSMPWFLILLAPSSDLALTMKRQDARKFLNRNRCEFRDFADFVRNADQSAARGAKRAHYA